MSLEDYLPPQKTQPFLEQVNALLPKVMHQRVLLANYLFDESAIKPSPFEAFGETKHPRYPLYFGIERLEEELTTLKTLLSLAEKKSLASFLTFTTEPTLLEKENLKAAKGPDSFSWYRALFMTLLHKYETSLYSYSKADKMVGTPLQDTVLDLLLNGPSAPKNIFVYKCQTEDQSIIGDSIREDFRNSAGLLKEVYDFDFERTMRQYAQMLDQLRSMVADPDKTPHLSVPFRRYLPKLDGIVPTPKKKVNTPEGKKEEEKERSYILLKEKISALKSWDELDKVVEQHYRSSIRIMGTELFTISFGFSGLTLVPKTQRKKIHFKELVGYDEQRKQLIANTERLLRGEDANNVFMHGPPGTGKSSMINALLTEYAGKGLRVVETDKEVIPHLPGVFSTLERSEYKFIVLVDEFRLGKDEDLYDALKKVVEGSFDGMPMNARLYVISNDKDSMRMGFSNGKEPRALEDRFGLVVPFPLPDQDHQREILKTYVGTKRRNGKLEQAWQQFQQYCSDRSINAPNPRNIRDFAKTLSS